MSWFENNSMPRVDEDTCLLKKSNITIITDVYDGIIETVIINVFGWSLLIVLFALLRKRAWEYGRLALIQSSHRWTNLFYGENSQDQQISDSSINSQTGSDSGCWWLPFLFRIKKSKIVEKYGMDASHYLSFQQHLLLVFAIYTLCSVCIVLPVNIQGHLESNSFALTTISNLEPNSYLFWFHIVLSLLFVPITFSIMKQSSGYVLESVASTKTIMVKNISSQHRNSGEIFRYFRLLYPDIVFKKVELAYDVKNLTKLLEEQEIVVSARVYSEIYAKRTSKQLTVSTGCCKKADAWEYYHEQETRLLECVDQERIRSLNRPLGIAFVTVATTETAEHIVSSFNPRACRDWTVSSAPPPSDIFWENLSVNTNYWYLKAILINMVLFIVLFFLTTPAIVVNRIDSINIIQEEIFNRLNPLISEFLPTLLLWSLAAAMPVIVAYSDEWLPYWSRSKQDHVIMLKTFYFLLFMILILPSFGMISVQAFVEWSLTPANQTYRWECVFLPDKGAFFVNYIITSALIGTALELIRFPELIVYGWRTLMLKSKAETASLKKSILLEFPFGVHYAWTLTIFTITTVYSLICPLITLFGLLYLTLKHGVDRYNLYYAYSPNTIKTVGRARLHSSAIEKTSIAMILLQTVMTSFSMIRGGIGIISSIMLAGLLLTVIISIFWSNNCLKVPVTTVQYPYELDYIAPVLQLSVFAERVTDISSGSEPRVDPNYGSSQIESTSAHLIDKITI